MHDIRGGVDDVPLYLRDGSRLNADVDKQVCAVCEARSRQAAV
jgi:hypothetical protein